MLSTQDQHAFQGRLTLALGEQAKQKRRWQDSLDFIRLRWFEANAPGTQFEKTEVHFSWILYNTIIPALYSHNPQFFTKSRNKNSFPFSSTMQDRLNYHKDELKLKDTAQRAIADAICYGIGWSEVGHHPTEPQRMELTQTRKPSLLQQIKQSVNLALKEESEEPLSAPGQLLPERKEGSLYVRWLPAYTVLLAPGYHLIRQMPYLITYEDIEMEELLDDPKYDSGQLRSIKPTRQVGGKTPGETSTPQPKRIGGFSMSGGPRYDFYRKFTCWDRRNRQVYETLEGNVEPIHWQRWPSSFDEFQQVPLIFNDTPPSEDDACPYPIDDISPLKPQLIELSLLRTSLVKARRRLAPYIIVDADLHQEDDIKKMQESEEFIIIPIRGGANGITPVTLAIPRDIFTTNDVILNDLFMISGFPQLMSEPPKGQTATAAQISQGGTNIRSSRRVDILEDWIKENARRMGALDWEFTDRDTVAEELGRPVSVEEWPDLPDSQAERQRKINKELSFSIESNSTQPDQIRLIEANLAIRDANMVTAAFGDVIDKHKYFRYYMKKKGDKDFEWTLKPDTEISKQEAEAENQLMLQGQFQLAHRGDRHDVHIPVHGQAALIAQQSGQDTSAIDQHIQMHAQLMQAENPQAGKSPQAGDIMSPQQASAPELQREGGENMADMGGQVQSIQQGLGPETSMVP